MSVLKPTAEQQAAIDAFVTGGTVVIHAGAGTGKTSTLRLLSATRPEAKGLYLAYNKAIQTEAEQSFPRNVDCRTAHSLAYRCFGAPMRSRLNGPRVTAKKAAGVLGAPWVPLDSGPDLDPSTVASMALRAVDRFCHSADVDMTRKHFVPPEAPGDTDLSGLAATVVSVARRAWADLSAPTGHLKPSHDVYLKLWHLSGPKFDYDFVLFDEAQDADPAIADVVTRQASQLIAVGDSAQAIYGWRGATDFLDQVEAEHHVALTQSWRFGPAVAEEANVWLGVIGSEMRLVGSPHRKSSLGPVDPPDAILCRTNGGCVSEVMAAQEDDRPVALVGGGEDMVRLAEASQRMTAGEPARHPELVAFKDWADVQDYAEHDPGGSDLAVAVHLIDKHGPEAIIGAIHSCVPESEAELTISTAHKAKGREWGQVLVGDDFRSPKDDPVTGMPGPVQREEAMLAYVTVTRAMCRLDNGGLAWVHDHPSVVGGMAKVKKDSPAPGRRYGHADQDPPGYDHAIAAGATRPEALVAAEAGAEMWRYAFARQSGQTHIEAMQAHESGTDQGAIDVTLKFVDEVPDHVDAPIEQAAERVSTTVRPPSLPAVGTQVRIRGHRRSAYRVTGFGSDGSVTLIGGPNGGWRSVMPERVAPIARPRKPNKPQPGATPSSDPVPDAARAVGL
jgi:hypothetical protein